MDDIFLDHEERDDPQLNPIHAIFLCHSGAQKAFVEQLYEDLKSRGQSPFFDQSSDCLPKGEVFAERIFKAARQCAVAVVVLSNEFLESKWPMLELATFVEAQNTLNPKLKLFPLFYKLEAPSLNEPNMTRIVELWREMAEADKRVRPDVWRNAVQVLDRANGLEFSKYVGSEVKYRKEIVDAVCKLCRRRVNREPSMIMEGEFDKKARGGVAQVGARILGLYGTGGLGKTFICKALCDHFSDEYLGRVCYVEYCDGTYLELLKFILEELTDIDERELHRIRSEKQADDLLKRFLPKQDVFLALDNLQDDHLDWPLLTYLSIKSKAVVTSRRMANVLSVVGSQAICLPCPTLTEPDALKLFLQSAGCAQPSMKWTNKESEILKTCIELSFFQDDLDSESSEKLHDAPGNSLVLESEEEMEMLRKCIELSTSLKINESGDSFERRGHYNPLVLVAMGATIKENYALEPMQLMAKCQRINFLPQLVQRRSLSDILGTGHDDLTGDEKLLFLDVALLYPITNLGDVEFLDVLDRLLKWLETVDRSPRTEILLKLKKQKDFNVSVWNDHGKEHTLCHNILKVLALEGASNRSSPASNLSAVPFLNKAIEILTLHKESIKGKADWEQITGACYISRGYAKITFDAFGGAIEDLLKANEFLPNHPFCLQLLGTAGAGCGRYQEALELLDRAIALYPMAGEGSKYARDGHYADAFAVRGAVKLKLHDVVGGKLDKDFSQALGSCLEVSV